MLEIFLCPQPQVLTQCHQSDRAYAGVVVPALIGSHLNPSLDEDAEFEFTYPPYHLAQTYTPPPTTIGKPRTASGQGATRATKE